MKRADYRKEMGDSKGMKPIQRSKFKGRRGPSLAKIKSGNKTIDNRSFAEIVKGVRPKKTSRTIVKVEEIGNGWLYASKIIRLKPQYSISELKEELKNRGLNEVLTRAGGGRDVVITFKTVEELKNKVCLWRVFSNGVNTSEGGRKVSILNKKEWCG